MRDLAKDMEVDKDNLDDECAGYPKLLAEYAEASRAAQKAKDDAELALAVEKAELESKIRQAPQSFGVAKVTEAAVHSALVRQESYQDAVKARDRSRRNLIAARNALRAIDRKEAAIKHLVKLRSQEYFGSLDGEASAPGHSRKRAMGRLHAEIVGNINSGGRR